MTYLDIRSDYLAGKDIFVETGVLCPSKIFHKRQFRKPYCVEHPRKEKCPEIRNKISKIKQM